jgi:hypothetical protein
MDFERAFFFLRKPRTIQRIVILKSNGGFFANKTWYKNTACKKSVHYLVSTDCRIVQMVEEADVAVFDKPNVNDISVSIEVEVTGGITEKQYLCISELVDGIVERWGIPLADTHITSLGFEPGEFDVNKLIILLKPVDIPVNEQIETLNQEALGSQALLKLIKSNLIGFFKDETRIVGMFIADETVRRKFGRDYGFNLVDSTDLLSLNRSIKEYEDQSVLINELKEELAIQYEINAKQAQRIFRQQLLPNMIRKLKEYLISVKR